MITFRSHLCATVFMAERSLSLKACWFMRSISFFLFSIANEFCMETEQLLTNCVVKMC